MAKKRTISTRRTTREQPRSGGIPPVVLIGGIIAGVLLLVGGLFYLGNAQGSNSSADLDLTGYPTFGDPDAPVTMIDFSDFG